MERGKVAERETAPFFETLQAVLKAEEETVKAEEKVRDDSHIGNWGRMRCSAEGVILG